MRSHGRYKTPEYRAWAAMIQRCSNPNNPQFQDYGGRGITVCSRWKSFAAFYEDMGDRPSRSHTLERVANGGNYQPGNCCWETRSAQARNRRSNTWVTHNGESLILNDWARRYAIAKSTVYQRIKRGWPISRALTEPVRKRSAA